LVILSSYVNKGMAERKTKWSGKEQEKRITRRTLPKEEPIKEKKTAYNKKS